LKTQADAADIYSTRTKPTPEITMADTAARVRLASVATAGLCALGLVLAPVATASTSHPTKADKVGAVHAYDHALLKDANSARSSKRTHRYAMNTKLRGIALQWAKHLASAGALSHNPDLVSDISKVCPHWTTLGENVGVSTGPSAGELFSAYMHSPPHKANILDKHYTVVGIETFTVTHDGVQQHWNVMDFANHCG
jgi:uncharacterized protein YkwD